MTHIPSYTKILNIGHPGISDLFAGDVVVEEKVDGSQFSFARGDDGAWCRSKGASIDPRACTQKMFDAACATVLELEPTLEPGWVYRGEYLNKPKHNTLAYDRTPAKHITIFDIMTGTESYLTPASKAAEAARLGLECVPAFYTGAVSSLDQFKSLLETTSFLGGQKIEGVVVKNYSRFGHDGKVIMGKYVREDFRELNSTDFRLRNPSQGDIIERLIERYRSPARWQKAVQHLTERGDLTSTPRDIGLLIKEMQTDVFDECAPEIAEALMAWARSKIARGISHGVAEWYKERLAAAAFGETGGDQ